MNWKRHFSIIATGALLLLAFVAGSASGGDFTTWTAILDGSASVPPSSATGTATITADYDLEGEPEFLTLNAEYFGLSGPVTAAAFYSGPPSSGGTLIWSVGTENPLVENLLIPLMQYAMFVQALYSDTLYLNVATGEPAKLDYPDGEIGGTFTLTSTVGDETQSWGGIKALFR